MACIITIQLIPIKLMGAFSLTTILTQARPPQARSIKSSSKIKKSIITQAVHPLVGEILLSVDEIDARVAEVGRQIAEDYAEKRPIVVTTLKGATIFASDLVRCITPVPEGLELQFVRASSYGAGTATTGTVSLGATTLKEGEVQGRHILLVEDIVDSGHTARALTAHFTAQGAASVAMAALLSKPARREVEYDPEYLCFTIPDKFVVGYGLDFAEHLRTLPYVGVLREVAYKSD